jgi:hypothetical protein
LGRRLCSATSRQPQQHATQNDIDGSHQCDCTARPDFFKTDNAFLYGLTPVTLCLVIERMKGAGGFKFLSGISLVCILWAANARGGPPLLTDDPDTPGPNHWEINIAMTSEEEAHQWELGTPLLDMNYGVGEHLQLKYQVPLEVYVPNEGGARVGMANSLAGIKWRFLDQTNGSWLEVSTYPQVEFIYPTSSIQRLQADDGDNLLLPIEMEHQFKSMTAYGEIGYVLNQKRPSEMFYGVADEYEFTEKFSLMAEFYGGFGRDFQENGLTFNIGFRRVLTEHIALIGSAGRAISGPREDAPTFQSYLGLQLTF